MSKQQIRLLIPLLIITAFLIYTWTVFFTTDNGATLLHYITILFFLIIVYFFFADVKKAIIATGLFLIGGTFNLLVLTPIIVSNSFGIRIGSIEIVTPQFQFQSFGILVLFLLLNFEALVNIYLDFKERRQTKNK